MKMPLTSDGNLQEHSEAKVKMLKAYLRNYLAVTTNTDRIDEVNIYDLFCGRGLYGKDAEGSPLAILRCVNEIYTDRIREGKRVPKLNCYFADEKLENVESVRNGITAFDLHKPGIGSLSVEPQKFDDSLQLVLSKSYNRSHKQFVFLDPTGYKDVRASQLATMLGKKAELLLFLPIQFMYRFISNATPAPLKEFISDLTDYSAWKPARSPGSLALQIRDLYRIFLGRNAYVSTFMIEKDSNTLFCMYFFTTSLLGYVKWIDAKWAVDEDQGSGYSFRNVPGQSTLVDGFAIALLEQKLVSFLRSGSRNNCDVFEFAVINEEFRSTHATQACKRLVADGRIKKRSLTGAPAHASAFYIGYEHFRDNNRKIEFEVVNDGTV